MIEKLDVALQESEQAKIRLRNDIFAILVASGYHRARIEHIDEYDRITGGIAWAIKRYGDVEVDANLLYEESAERKIALRTEQSEEIIKALKKIKSPFELSAHQLQGLDYGALKNVVQWLIRRVLMRNSRKIDRNRKIRNWMVADCPKDSKIEGLKKNVSETTRYRKRMNSDMKFELGMDARCTLAEYSECAGRSSEEECNSQNITIVEDDRNLQEASSKKHVPTKSIIQMLETAVVDSDFDSETTTTSTIPEIGLPEKLNQLEIRLTNEKELYQKVKSRHDELLGRLENFEQKMGRSDEKEIEQITELLKSFHASEFRAQELKNYELEEISEDQNSNGAETEKYRQYKNAIQTEYDVKTGEYAASTREVQNLQFELDQLLGVNLSSHYRKRNMERLQNSADYTEEAKAAVIDYNVSIDILKFSGRITKFINELEQSLLKEPATQEYRDAFVSYVNNVRTQLGEYHWKAKQSQEKTVQEKKQLETTRSEIRQQEREVANVSAELKKLLDTNSKLQDVIRSL